jgi:hypothetical protein
VSEEAAGDLSPHAPVIPGVCIFSGEAQTWWNRHTVPAFLVKFPARGAQQKQFVPRSLGGVEEPRASHTSSVSCVVPARLLPLSTHLCSELGHGGQNNGSTFKKMPQSAQVQVPRPMNMPLNTEKSQVNLSLLAHFSDCLNVGCLSKIDQLKRWP